MTIKTKPLDIQLTLYNGGILTIREDNPHFDARYLLKTLHLLIPQHLKHMLNSSKKNFSEEELRIQLVELKEASRILINLMKET